jgi:hypothetical protein
MTAAEKRQAVVKKYEEILGRNKYSQSLRDYCYKKYKDGKYYSDCSSSVSYAYKEAGFSFGILNTVGMYQSKKLVDVPVYLALIPSAAEVWGDRLPEGAPTLDQERIFASLSERTQAQVLRLSSFLSHIHFPLFISC